MPELGPQRLALSRGQAPWQGAAQARTVTGLDGMPRHEPPRHQQVTNVCAGLPPPLARRRCQVLRVVVCVVVCQAALHVLHRARLSGRRDGGTAEPQSQGITLDRLPGVVPPRKRGLPLVPSGVDVSQA